MRKFRVPVAPKPKNRFKIKVVNKDKECIKEYEVDPDNVPYGRHGLPGSILDVISEVDEDLIDHACGGVQACSTCHVYVSKGLDTTNEVSDREQDYIDQAMGPKLISRLACCCVGDGTSDLEVEIPEWNKNAVREGK